MSQSKLAGFNKPTTHERAFIATAVLTKHHLFPTSGTPPRNANRRAVDIHLTIAQNFP